MNSASLNPEASGRVVLEVEGSRSVIEIVASDLLAKARALTEPRRGLILMDQAFAAEAMDWQKNLPGFSVIFSVRPGEEAKNLDEARLIMSAMAEAKLARDDWLIVRGGGSLTDLGGFCAGLYRRGLNLMLIPTTLLGAVDAAVGGKTAVNFAGAKNQLGHFYLPRWVLADLASFATLPRRRVAEGLVEAYKTGLLFDERLARLVENESQALLTGRPDLLAEAVQLSAKAKAALVARDFREEKGLRDILNLGHTYGHAAESFYAPDLSHGRAVGLGLAVTAVFSLAQGGLDRDAAEKIIETAAALSAPWPKLPPADKALELLKADKKIRGGQLKFVVLEGVGRPALIEAEAADVLKAAADLRSNYGRFFPES